MRVGRQREAAHRATSLAYSHSELQLADAPVPGPKEMDDNAQLLAHAGAPSSRKDDDRRKAQLRSYVATRPTRILRISLPNVAKTVIDQALEPRYSSLSRETIDPTHYLEDTQLAYTALESQLFPSARDIVRVAHPVSKESTSRTRQVVIETTPRRGNNDAIALRSSATNNILSDNDGSSQSSYLVSPFALRSSQGRSSLRKSSGVPFSILNTDRQPVNPNARPSGEGSEISVLALHVGKTSVQETTKITEVTSELPSSYSLSERGSESVNELAGSLREKSANVSKRRKSQETKQQALNRIASEAAGPVERDFATPAEMSSPAIHDNMPHQNSCLSASTIATLQNVSMAIDPPEPEMGCGSFETHITTALHRTALNHEIAKAYNPISIKRELRLLERGYWRVDCSVWPLERQLELWRYLETSIRSGKLGWGVRCTREANRPVESSAGGRRNDSNSSANRIRARVTPHGYTFGPIKVYCWGEIVKHIYLLLYIASRSQIRKLGLQWIDAEGLVVVQMR